MIGNYKLHGFLNLFDVIPDFVFPVFECDGEFFFQHGRENVVEEFIKVKMEALERVSKLQDGVIFSISIGSAPVYAFQYDSTSIVYGYADYIKNKLEGFSTNDLILRKQIQNFFEDVKEPIKKRSYSASSFSAVGRRKSAVARVRLLPGEGKILVNKRDINDYFGLETLKMTIRQPLHLANVGPFDVQVNVRGGGLTGQAGAIRHGISRALCLAYPELRPTLKKAGLLTRDPRMKERKKYGLKAARRAPQFSKR